MPLLTVAIYQRRCTTPPGLPGILCPQATQETHNRERDSARETCSNTAPGRSHGMGQYSNKRHAIACKETRERASGNGAEGAPDHADPWKSHLRSSRAQKPRIAPASRAALIAIESQFTCEAQRQSEKGRTDQYSSCSHSRLGISREAEHGYDKGYTGARGDACVACADAEIGRC